MRTLLTGMMVVLLCVAAAAQEPTPAPGATLNPAQPAADPSKRRPIDGTVRFDIVITDTAGPKPVTKSLSLTVANAGQGSIRTSARLPGGRQVTTLDTLKDGKPNTIFLPPENIPLNVDVRGVVLFPDNVVRAQVVVEYQPYVENAATQPATVSASAMTEFMSGRKVTILQSADPVSDRRTTIDVTATILK